MSTINKARRGGSNKVRKDMQEKIDQYVAHHKQFREAENAMNKLRKEIEPYLQDKGIREVEASNGSKMVIETQNKAPITARYTSYDLDDLVQVVDDFNILADCMVEVVDRELLELQVKAGNLGEELLELKIYNAVDSLTVKHIRG